MKNKIVEEVMGERKELMKFIDKNRKLNTQDIVDAIIINWIEPLIQKNNEWWIERIEKTKRSLGYWLNKCSIDKTGLTQQEFDIIMGVVANHFDKLKKEVRG